MQDVNSGDHCGDSSDPFADATRAVADTATVPNAPQVATISSCRANSSLTCPARRALLITALAGCIGVVTRETAHAQDDAPGSDERPKKGDLLVFADGDHASAVIKPEDLPLGGPPVMAWPMDPATKVIRNGSRLNELLVVRFDPADLDDDTRPRAADGILAYSAVCTHAGCDVTGWAKATEGGNNVFKCLCHNSEYDPRQSAQVVFGPAPRRLAALPLAKADHALTITAPFIGKVGAQQSL